MHVVIYAISANYAIFSTFCHIKDAEVPVKERLSALHNKGPPEGSTEEVPRVYKCLQGTIFPVFSVLVDVEVYE